MKLNGATLETMLVGDITYENSGEFVRALKVANNILADVYINGHRVATSKVNFSEENGWLNASLNFRFSLDEPVLTDSVMIRAYNAGNKDIPIMSTMTMVKEYIEPGDQNAELRFNVMSATPFNSRKRPHIESKIRWMRSELLHEEKLEDLPTDDSVEPTPEPERVDATLIDATNFDSLRHAMPLSEYYENYPNFGEIESTWDNPEWIDHSHWPWLCITKDFDKPYRVVVKFKATGSDEFEVKYNSDTDFPDGVPVTAGTQSGEPADRKYFLISVPDDMHMNGYDASGTVYVPNDGEFEVWFTPAE